MSCWRGYAGSESGFMVLNMGIGEYGEKRGGSEAVAVGHGGKPLALSQKADAYTYNTT